MVFKNALNRFIQVSHILSVSDKNTQKKKLVSLLKLHRTSNIHTHVFLKGMLLSCPLGRRDFRTLRTLKAAPMRVSKMFADRLALLLKLAFNCRLLVVAHCLACTGIARAST